MLFAALPVTLAEFVPAAVREQSRLRQGQGQRGVSRSTRCHPAVTASLITTPLPLGKQLVRVANSGLVVPWRDPESAQ